MKLTKEDYMRLPKERLAELLVELQETPTITTPDPSPMPYTPPPSIPYDPWRNPYNPYPYGPTITYADSPNTNETKGDDNLHAY
jgi:hypothetical protein